MDDDCRREVTPVVLVIWSATSSKFGVWIALANLPLPLQRQERQERFFYAQFAMMTLRHQTMQDWDWATVKRQDLELIIVPEIAGDLEQTQWQLGTLETQSSFS
jgi:hypothetical protein